MSELKFSKSKKMSRFTLCQSVVSQQKADELDLIILPTPEYAERFFITKSAVLERIRKRKVRAFKQAGKWFIVLPEKCPTGFEYPGL